MKYDMIEKNLDIMNMENMIAIINFINIKNTITGEILVFLFITGEVIGWKLSTECTFNLSSDLFLLTILTVSWWVFEKDNKSLNEQAINLDGKSGKLFK